MSNSTTQKRQPQSPFKRYTDLAAAIHMLQTKQITLLNPATWDDQNDAYFMAEYKRIIDAQTVLALCFAERKETYHHWKVFSKGSDGVCIEFDKDALMYSFDRYPNIRRGRVKYKLISSLKKKPSIEAEQLPFLKRKPYEDECEYRVVYVDRDEQHMFRDFPIEVSWIKRITLSPWMSKTLRNSVASTLKAIPGCANLSVVRSTLIANDEWQAVTANAY